MRQVVTQKVSCTDQRGIMHVITNYRCFATNNEVSRNNHWMGVMWWPKRYCETTKCVVLWPKSVNVLRSMLYIMTKDPSCNGRDKNVKTKRISWYDQRDVLQLQWPISVMHVMTKMVLRIHCSATIGYYFIILSVHITNSKFKSWPQRWMKFLL